MSEKKPLKAYISVTGKVYEIGNAEDAREILRQQRSGGMFKIEGLGTLVVEAIRPNFKGSHMRLLFMTRQVLPFDTSFYSRILNRRRKR